MEKRLKSLNVSLLAGLVLAAKISLRVLLNDTLASCLFLRVAPSSKLGFSLASESRYTTSSLDKCKIESVVVKSIGVILV